MTDAERDALEWLEQFDRASSHPRDVQSSRTLKALLAEPRLPAEPRDAVLRLMDQAFGDAVGNDLDWQRAAYAALYRYLTPPADHLEEIRRYGT